MDQFKEQQRLKNEAEGAEARREEEAREGFEELDEARMARLGDGSSKDKDKKKKDKSKKISTSRRSTRAGTTNPTRRRRRRNASGTARRPAAPPTRPTPKSLPRQKRRRLPRTPMGRSHFAASLTIMAATRNDHRCSQMRLKAESHRGAVCVVTLTAVLSCPAAVRPPAREPSMVSEALRDGRVFARS